MKLTGYKCDRSPDKEGVSEDKVRTVCIPLEGICEGNMNCS